MKALVGPARSGKTTHLIELAAAQDLCLVCADSKRIAYVQALARKKGLKIRQPLTYDQVIYDRVGPMGMRGFVFDDVDRLLQRIADGRPVVAFAAWDGSALMARPTEYPDTETPE